MSGIMRFRLLLSPPVDVITANSSEAVHFSLNGEISAALDYIDNPFCDFCSMAANFRYIGKKTNARKI
ncbi:hypothetical protein NIES4074_04540 [Cylindrospermum sp. NIES-4074]|nr:hypothetical protein NIES4074_04540 [Cylindrospermum sp. NIES-4074]